MKGASCRENEALLQYLLQKKEERENDPRTSELVQVFGKAAKAVRDCPLPITDSKNAQRLKGIGPFLGNLLENGFFAKRRGGGGHEEEPEEPDVAQPTPPRENDPGAAQRAEEKGYLPQQNSAPYALLITLFRKTEEGQTFLLKEQFIKAAEESGLSESGIRPTGKVLAEGARPAAASGSAGWYCGWSTMRTLQRHKLVAKAGNPARYSLTMAGYAVAVECQKCSGLLPPDFLGEFVGRAPSPSKPPPGKKARAQAAAGGGAPAAARGGAAADASLPGTAPPPEAAAGRRTPTGHGRGRPTTASKARQKPAPGQAAALRTCTAARQPPAGPAVPPPFPGPSGGTAASAPARSSGADAGRRPPHLRLPPLRPGQSFAEVYEVVLLVDIYEKFGGNAGGDNLQEVVGQLVHNHGIKAEAERNLPVGDALWVACDRRTRAEFVLDFVAERKRVDDLLLSVTGKKNRFQKQKLGMLRCGLRKLIYLVEGDPGSTGKAPTIKTAELHTEIDDGFDVHRTRDRNHTVRHYAHVTRAIAAACCAAAAAPAAAGPRCPTYAEFEKRCAERLATTAEDRLGLLLVQVNKVTEEKALAIMEKYPTLPHLLDAYQALEGNVEAQRHMLVDLRPACSGQLISKAISERVFDLVWRA